MKSGADGVCTVALYFVDGKPEPLDMLSGPKERTKQHNIQQHPPNRSVSGMHLVVLKQPMKSLNPQAYRGTVLGVWDAQVLAGDVHQLQLKLRHAPLVCNSVRGAVEGARLGGVATRPNMSEGRRLSMCKQRNATSAQLSNAVALAAACRLTNGMPHQSCCSSLHQPILCAAAWPPK